jgi:hypothetical protein
VVVVTLGLFGGQYHATGEARYLYAGIVTVFLDGLRYMDALQIVKVRREMSMRLLQARNEVSSAVDCLDRVQRLRGGHDAAVDAALAEGRRSLISAAAASRRLGQDADEDSPALPTTLRGGPPPSPERAINSEISSGFNRLVPWYPRFRDAMVRRRIRTHLVSGVEFQMFVFIVGPAVNQVLPVMIAAAVGLLGFEIVILVKLGMATREFVRLRTRTEDLADSLGLVTETVDPDGTLRRAVQTTVS